MFPFVTDNRAFPTTSSSMKSQRVGLGTDYTWSPMHGGPLCTVVPLQRTNGGEESTLHTGMGTLSLLGTRLDSGLSVEEIESGWGS